MDHDVRECQLPLIRYFFIWSQCSLGMWTVSRDDNLIEGFDWNCTAQLSSRNSCAGKFAFVFMRPQSRSKQKRAQTKIYSGNDVMSQKDRPSSSDPCHWWPMGMWLIWVQQCESKGGQNLVFTRNSLWSKQIWMRPSPLSMYSSWSRKSVSSATFHLAWAAESDIKITSTIRSNSDNCRWKSSFASGKLLAVCT